MKQKNILFLSACLCFMIITANLFANSFAETYGFSAEGIARGNAMTAVVNDWSSLWYNMAGLGKTQNLLSSPDSDKKEVYANQLAVGYLLAVPKLKLDVPQRFYGAYPNYYPVPTHAADKKPYGFINFGGALDLTNFIPTPDFISSLRLGFTMGVNQDFSMSKITNVDPRDHNFIRFGKGIQRAMILSGIGIGFLNDAFGGGVGINMNFHGKIRSDLDTILTLSPASVQFPVTRNSFDLNIVPAAMAGVYLSPGKFIKALDGLEIGATYRQENQLKLFPFTANVLVQGAVSVMLLMEVLDYYSPHTVNGSIAYTIAGLTVSAELGYEMWSHSVFTNNVEANYAGIPKFRDIFVYRGGIKYDTPLTWLTVMLGYSYVPSVLPEYSGRKLGIRLPGTAFGLTNPQVISGMYNALDNDKHLASVGLKFKMPKMGKPQGEMYLTLAYQFQYLTPRTARHFGDLLALGTNAWFDSYLYNPSYSFGGLSHCLSVEVGTRI
jgi:hypothetical protein